MGVEAQAVPTSQLSGFHHQSGGHREGAARSDYHVDHFPVVVPGHDRLGGRQDGVPILDHMVGGQPTIFLAEVHRPARQVEAYPDLSGRVDHRVEHRVVTPRDEVVVVGGGGTPGDRQFSQADQRGGSHVVDREAAPNRVEVNQPVEEVATGSPTPGHPLVEVVVGVDEPGGDNVTRASQHLVARFRLYGAHLGDPTVLNGDVARVTGAPDDEPSGHGDQPEKVSIIKCTSGPSG